MFPAPDRSAIPRSRSDHESIFRDSRGKVCPSTLCPLTRLVKNGMGGQLSRISPCVALTSSHHPWIPVRCVRACVRESFPPLSLPFVVQACFSRFSREVEEREKKGGRKGGGGGIRSEVKRGEGRGKGAGGAALLAEDLYRGWIDQILGCNCAYTCKLARVHNMRVL